MTISGFRDLNCMRMLQDGRLTGTFMLFLRCVAGAWLCRIAASYFSYPRLRCESLLLDGPLM